MYPIMLLPHTFNNESLSTMQGALWIVKCCPKWFWRLLNWGGVSLTVQYTILQHQQWKYGFLKKEITPISSVLVKHSWILAPIQKESECLLPICHFLSYLIPAQVWSLPGWEQNPTDLFICLWLVGHRHKLSLKYCCCVWYIRDGSGDDVCYVDYDISPRSPQRFVIWWWSMMIMIMTMMASVWYVDH